MGNKLHKSRYSMRLDGVNHCRTNVHIFIKYRFQFIDDGSILNLESLKPSIFLSVMKSGEIKEPKM